MKNMIIREYCPKTDREQILNEFGKCSRRRESKLDTVEANELHHCYVAEEEGTVKGFIIMEDLGKGPNYYMVQVNAREKRKHIGKQLVEYVFEQIGKGGHISLNVNTTNIDAILFYISLGFEYSGFNEDYRKGQNKIWFKKDL